MIDVYPPSKVKPSLMIGPYCFPKDKVLFIIVIMFAIVFVSGLISDIWEYGAREAGDFLLVNSTHLERHYGGDRIKHSHTPPTMREKP